MLTGHDRGLERAAPARPRVLADGARARRDQLLAITARGLWGEAVQGLTGLRRDPGEETGFYASDYRQAYRNVASLFRKHAPNVALVWCPNSGLLGGERREGVHDAHAARLHCRHLA